MYNNSAYPIIVLVEPQLGVNVGMIARTILNFNFNQLRIVKPRDDEVIKSALAASCGADEVLAKCEVFESLHTAVADLQLVYATTNRSRYMHKPISPLFEAFSNITFKESKSDAKKIGFLFGKESRGLSNNDLNYAHILIKIETNPNFGSLNIVQAVALVCYEWHKGFLLYENRELNSGNNKNTSILNKDVATFADYEFFFNYIESFLESKKFFPLDKKESMIRNFRNIFLRTQLTKSEIKTLFRIIKALINTN